LEVVTAAVAPLSLVLVVQVWPEERAAVAAPVATAAPHQKGSPAVIVTAEILVRMGFADLMVYLAILEARAHLALLG
jgi:hypothetical protein